MASVSSVGRTIRGLGTTLVLGGSVGFVAMAVITPFLPGPTQPGDLHEPPNTRQYVLALLNRDAAMVNRLTIPQSPVERALLWEEMLADESVTLDTLTYVGGSAGEIFSSHVYVVGARAADQTYRVAPVELTLAGDKVYFWRGTFDIINQGAPLPAPPSPSPAGSGSPAPSGSGPAPSGSEAPSGSPSATP